MDAKLQILEDTLKNEYSPENFVRFTKEFFNSIKITYSEKEKDNDHIYKEYTDAVVSYRHMAQYKYDDKNILDVFAVKLRNDKSIERARSLQRSFISKLLSSNNHDAAIVAFYCDNDPRWRLSFVKLDYEFAGGCAKMNLTPAKRYSYLVGLGEPCHTAQEQLYHILIEENCNPTLDKIEEAFSVENVTKRFFAEYREKYLKLKEYLDVNEAFSQEAQQHQFTSEQFAKKLMGQLAFLYFLQKKGWLGVKVVPHSINKKQYDNAFYKTKASREVISRIFKQVAPDKFQLNINLLISKEFSDYDADVLAGCFRNFKSDDFLAEKWGDGTRIFIRDLFESCNKLRGKSFFNDYLEPLFYEALNQKRGENSYYKKFNCKIPFLNGGLFEPLENYDWGHTDFGIPNEIFSNRAEKGEREADGILDIFDRYNFTMNEDEPLEREVAVDPEMLGKIFENLLDTTDRKSKGAFYTPREIVHYMCQESITNYLVNETGIPYDDIKQFILLGEFMKDEDCSRATIQGEKLRQIPDSVYSNLRNIDKALENIRIADPAVGSGAFPLGILSEIVKARNNITYYFVAALERKSDQKRKFEERDPYKLKWDTIQNSIFAVDIEASAVDISKLRLWLSLVVDENLDPTEDDILDAQANNTEPKQKDPHPLPNLDCNIMCGNSLIDEFDGIKLFDESLLNKKDHNTKGANYDLQLSLIEDSTEKMLEDLFAEQERYFGENNNDAKKKIKANIDKLTDELIRVKLSDNSEGLKKYDESLKQKTKPYFLWKLEFAKVFREKGGFDVVIGNPPYVLLQDITKDKTIVNRYKEKYQVASYKIDLYHLFIQKGIDLLNIKGTNSFITPSNFTTNNYCIELRKYLLSSTSIKNIVFYDENVFDANVNNLVYVATRMLEENNLVTINKAKREKAKWINFDLIIIGQKSFMKDEYLLIPISDMSYVNVLNKIENNSQPLKSLGKVNFGMQLRDRTKYPLDVTTDETLITLHHKPCYTGKDINKYNVNYVGRYCYFNRDEAKCGGCWDEAAQFAVPKLLVRQIGTYPIVGIDMNGYALLNTAFMITSFSNSLSPYTLLGILNSKLIRFYWMQKFSDNRKQFPKIKGSYLDKLPISTSNINAQIKISKIIEQILNIKQSDQTADIAALELQIDQMVYELYNLTEEEIKIIEEA